MKNMERVSALETKMRVAISESSPTYREVIHLLPALRRSYLSSALSAKVDGENIKKVENREKTLTLETQLRALVAESGCTYSEVIDLLADLRFRYLSSAFNRVVKSIDEDWTKAT